MNAITGRSDGWDPVAASAGPGVEALLTSFTYSGNGAAPGSSQRFTLRNLTPGANYDFRLYMRSWSAVGSGRPIDLVFTNGTEIVQPFNALPEDRPGIVTGSGNNNDAYYLTYQYTAQTSELVLDASIPLCSINPSGSLHLYGLSNEISTGVLPGQILITSQLLSPSGQFVIDFKAKPQTTYQVTKSSDLSGDFAPPERAPKLHHRHQWRWPGDHPGPGNLRPQRVLSDREIILVARLPFYHTGRSSFVGTAHFFPLP